MCSGRLDDNIVISLYMMKSSNQSLLLISIHSMQVEISQYLHSVCSLTLWVGHGVQLSKWRRNKKDKVNASKEQCGRSLRGSSRKLSSWSLHNVADSFIQSTSAIAVGRSNNISCNLVILVDIFTATHLWIVTISNGGQFGLNEQESSRLTRAE